MESFDLFVEPQPWMDLVIDLLPPPPKKKKKQNKIQMCNFASFLNK
jgi:hypothetical protein